jgi:predicted nuclease with RNAse H fold
MPPTMIRMVYLTLRGLQLTRILESLKPQYDLRIVETHPGAFMILRSANQTEVRNFKKDFGAREHLLDWLESQGVKGITGAEKPTDHYVAACAAALGAWQWNMGKSLWCFEAEPPHHPYDFAC